MINRHGAFWWCTYELGCTYVQLLISYCQIILLSSKAAGVARLHGCTAGCTSNRGSLSILNRFAFEFKNFAHSKLSAGMAARLETLRKSRGKWSSYVLIWRVNRESHLNRAWSKFTAPASESREHVKRRLLLGLIFTPQIQRDTPHTYSDRRVQPSAFRKSLTWLSVLLHKAGAIISYSHSRDALHPWATKKCPVRKHTESEVPTSACP